MISKPDEPEKRCVLGLASCSSQTQKNSKIPTSVSDISDDYSTPLSTRLWFVFIGWPECWRKTEPEAVWSRTCSAR